MKKYVSPEQARENAKRWYVKNHTRELAKRLAWRKKNKKYASTYSGTYRYSSKERYATALWSCCKLRAKKKDLPFEINKSDIQIPEICPVLGIPLVVKQGGRQNGTPTVDRIKPELGYIQGNITVISWRANRLKNDATLEEMQAVLKYMCQDMEQNIQDSLGEVDLCV